MMFGFYRTMLAIWVMAFHLLEVPLIGAYAVFAFFVLSGFLMTHIMHESYGYSSQGVMRFSLNRFFRLYPIYWISILISILIILLCNDDYIRDYKDALFIPADWQAWVMNLLMIFPAVLPYDITPRLSPPTWALTVELFFYACIALGFSKTYKRTLVWIILSVCYYAYSYINGLPAGYRYATIFAASLPFSVGAMLYFKKEYFFSILKYLKLSHPSVVLSIYIANAIVFSLNAHFMPFNISYYLGGVGKYLNILLAMFTITALIFRGHEIISKQLDKLLGDYSYPIYLLHWQSGALASFFLFTEPTLGFSTGGAQVFSLAILIVLFFSWVMMKLTNSPIERIRNKIRQQK